MYINVFVPAAEEPMDVSQCEQQTAPSEKAEKHEEAGEGEASESQALEPASSEQGEADVKKETTEKQRSTRCGRRSSQIQDPDNFLLYLGDTLEQLHNRFYSQFDEMAKDIDFSSTTDIPTPDLKKIIPELRQSVLKGANILFTGVIPTNMPPERSPEWNTARAFGATVHSRLIRGLDSSDPHKALSATTHVIVGKPGTSKLKDARRISGMRIVSPKWLWSCAERWRWADEREFPSEHEKGVVVQAAAASPRERRASNSRLPRRKASRLTGDEVRSKRPNDSAATARKRTDSQEESSRYKAPNSTRRRVPEIADRKKLAELEPKERHRLISLESRMSVSDEEFDRMEAEVDAEISSISSSGGGESEREEEEDVGMARMGVVNDLKEAGTHKKGTDEMLGGIVQDLKDESLSYDQFIGEGKDVFTSGPTRKRKRDEIEADSSSNSNSPLNHSLVDAEGEWDYGGDSDESGDELAAFLGGRNQSGAGADSESD